MRHSLLAALLLLLSATPALAVPVGTSADTRPAAPQQRQLWKSQGLTVKLGGSFMQGNVNLATLSSSLSANVNRGQHQLFLDAGNFYTGSGAQVLVNRVAASALYAYSAADNFNTFAYTT